MIDFRGDTMRIPFTRFTAAEYPLFLRCKRLPESRTIFHPDTETYTIEAPARFAHLLDAAAPATTAPTLPLLPQLFDDQVAIVRMALDAKRFAVWSDCGLGKTLIELEFARQVSHRTGGGRVLIVTLNEIIPQYAEEAARFYGADADAYPITRLRTRDEMREWCERGTVSGKPTNPASTVAITNYEKWNPPSLADQVVNEARHLVGIVLDESSRLKAGGGKQKWALIKSCRGIEYKLSCTATPAPNDIMEFASQASFLEKMRTESEIIWTFFVRDSKSHRWTVKRHARRAFFEFMSSWSIYVREPERYGWRIGMAKIPEPELHVHEIEPTPEQRTALVALSTDTVTGQGYLWYDRDTNAIQRGKLSQIAKGFAYRKGGRTAGYDVVPSLKPAAVARLVRDERKAGLQVLVWTVFDAESEVLAAELDRLRVPYDLLTGATTPDNRLNILEAFRTGARRVLVSRASVLGYGMNLQACGSMIFSGWNDSFESYYQAVRRAYRYGQTRRLRVHIPVVRDLEGDMLENILRKESAHNAAIEEMEANYVAVMAGMAAGTTQPLKEKPWKI